LPPLKVTLVVFHTNVLTRNGGLFHSSEKPILDTTEMDQQFQILHW
jgi:hypothetical protein